MHPGMHLRAPAGLTARLPRALSLLLLAGGLALAAWAPLAGAPPALAPLLGQPGAIKTFDPRLQELERDIAAGQPRSFTIRMSQAAIDAELAAQLRRAGGRVPVSGAALRSGPDVLNASGVLTVGPAALPASMELSVWADRCRPMAEISSLAVGGGETPGWLRERAEALVRGTLDDILARGLGFCLESVSLREGEIIFAGRVEGQP